MFQSRILSIKIKKKKQSIGLRKESLAMWNTVELGFKKKISHVHFNDTLILEVTPQESYKVN